MNIHTFKKDSDYYIFILHLYSCIWLTLLSKTTNYQKIEPMTSRCTLPATRILRLNTVAVINLSQILKQMV